MITLFCRAPSGEVTDSTWRTDRVEIGQNVFSGALVSYGEGPKAFHLIAANSIVVIERVGRSEYIVRNVDDRLVKKGRATVHVRGRVLEMSKGALLRDGEVVRIDEWTVRVGKPRRSLPLLTDKSRVVEDRFLEALRKSPNDEGMREVYADWLEETGSPSAAEMLRTEIRVAKLSEEDPKHAAAARALRDAARDVDDDWRQKVARPRIEKCDRTKEEEEEEGEEEREEPDFALECPKEWTKLERKGENERVRFCHACEKPVTYCVSLGEAKTIASQGGCVALDPSITRTKDDLKPEELKPLYRMGVLRIQR